MKAVVFHGIGDIRLDNVPEPKIQDSTDAIVRLTSSAICGTDLHMIRGTFTGMKPGTILGHEGIGIIEEIGSNVRNLKVGEALSRRFANALSFLQQLLAATVLIVVRGIILNAIIPIPTVVVQGRLFLVVQKRQVRLTACKQNTLGFPLPMRD